MDVGRIAYLASACVPTCHAQQGSGKHAGSKEHGPGKLGPPHLPWLPMGNPARLSEIKHESHGVAKKPKPLDGMDGA
ncbi:hypothetical protein CS8_017290 [Cupriavidus sp. 8B]